MKTSIKRFSRSSISIVLVVMMLVTSLTFGVVNFNAVTLNDSDSSAVSAASENDAVGANFDDSERVAANADDSVGGTATTIYFVPSLDSNVSTYCNGDGSIKSGYTLRANFNRKGDGSDWAYVNMTVDSGTYSGKKVYKASFTDSYNGLGELQFQIYEGGTYKAQHVVFNNWTAVSNYNGKLYNGSTWVTYSGGGTPVNPGQNVYNAVASTAIKNNSNLYTINTTFYDYYTDNEVNNGWRKFSNIDSAHGTSYESHGKNGAGQADPYTKLNTALANYAQTNGVSRPLYFGVFYNVDDNTTTDPFGATLYNFSNWVNNSSRLGNYNNSVVGLTGKTLKDTGKNINYYSNTGENENGAAMPLFDANWLISQNLATVVNAEFPMRKTTKSGVTYYEFNSDKTDAAWLSGYGSDTLTMNYGNQDKDWVYDAASNYGGGNNGVGFFPFDISEKNGGNTHNNANDYGFGMRTDIEFNVGKDGRINGVSQEFNFTGDDDLWVFIDGQLVLDLGGAHKKAEGSIDFSTKTVKLTTGTNKVNNATRNTNFTFDNQDPSKTHTLTMFYMERGMIESNLKFGFNFSPVGNQFTTENHVDTANVNEGLKSAVAAADTFTYTHKTNGYASSNKTYTHSKDGSKSTNNAGQYVVNNSERAAFTDQFTVGNTFNVVESHSSSNLQYDTTYKVTDQRTGANIKSGSGTGTGDFNFKTTDTAQFAKTDILLSYTNTPKVGNVDVSKIVQNESGTAITTDNTEFDATVEVSLNGGTTYNKYPLQYTVDSGSTVYTLTSGGKLASGAKLKAGRTLHFKGVPIGAKVKVTEDTAAKYDTTVQVTGGASKASSSADVTVANATQTITFTNKKQATTPIKVQHLLHSNSPANSTDKLYTTIKVYKNRVLQQTVCTNKDTSTSPATIPAEYIVKGEGYTFTVQLTTKPKTSYMFNDFYDNDETKELGNGDFNNYTSYTKDTNNETSTIITVNVDSLFNGDTVNSKYLLLKFYSLLSTDVKYQIDYLFTTRLYNDRIYTVKGKLTDDEINTYFGGVVPTELNDAFVQSKIPYESNFMKNLRWYDIARDKKIISGNTLYAKLSSVQTDKTVSARIYNNSDTPVIVSGVAYGDPFTVNDAETAYQKEDGHYLQVKIPEDKFFSYWAIYKAATFGTDDQVEVARCYSEYFNYTGYDDYVVKAIFTKDPKKKNTELYVSEDENLCTAVYLQTTRNHWNNTTTGKDVSGKYGSANTEYDRIYLDFALAYNYKGILLQKYNGNDIKIGVKIYAVKDGEARVLKDAKFKLTDLDNKNRLEYYYGIDNTRPNFQNYTYYAVPYLTVNDAAPAKMKITNSGTVAIKNIATKPLSGDNKYTAPTLDNVIYG